MEDKTTTDSNPEETEEWPAGYEPPMLDELGPVWEETGGAIGTTTDGALLQT